MITGAAAAGRISRTAIVADAAKVAGTAVIPKTTAAGKTGVAAITAITEGIATEAIIAIRILKNVSNKKFA